MNSAAKAALFAMLIIGGCLGSNPSVKAEAINESGYQKLVIRPVCSDPVTKKVTWDITNNNPFPIPYMWEHLASMTNSYEDAPTGTARIYSAYTPGDPDGNLTGFQSKHPASAWMDYSIKLYPATQACDVNDTVLHDCVSAMGINAFEMDDTPVGSASFRTLNKRPLCDDTLFTLSSYQLPDDMTDPGGVAPSPAPYATRSSKAVLGLPFDGFMQVDLPESCRNIHQVLTANVSGQTYVLSDKTASGYGECTDGTTPCRSNCRAVPTRVLSEHIEPTDTAVSPLVAAHAPGNPATSDATFSAQQRMPVAPGHFPRSLPETGTDRRMWIYALLFAVITYCVIYILQEAYLPYRTYRRQL